MNSESGSAVLTQSYANDSGLWSRVKLRLRSTDALLVVLLAVASFLVYLRTLAPDIVDADGGEFQFAAWSFSIVHPTGYPLFLILGGLFQHLVPFGNPAFRLNLFTALSAAVAVPLLYGIVLELTGHRVAALVAAASFALSRMFWYDASAAEVYDFFALLLMLLILACLRWRKTPSFRNSALLCFLFGLALAHHRAILLWLPAFAMFAVVAAKKSTSTSVIGIRLGQSLAMVSLVLLPLLLYLYVPLRAAASPFASLRVSEGNVIQVYDGSPQGFLNYVLGRTFQSELTWDQISAARLAAMPGQLLDQYGPLGAILGLIGLAFFFVRRDWASLTLLVVGAICTVAFAAAYHIGDIEHYYTPVYLVWAIWIGVGVADIAGLVQRAWPSWKSRWVSPFATFYLLVGVSLLVFQWVTNLPLADRSQDNPRLEWSKILNAQIPSTAILVTNDRDEMTPFWYLQSVEGVHRDILGVFPLITASPEYANVVRLTDTMLKSARPVLFIKPMPGLQVRYQLDSAHLPTVRVIGTSANVKPQFGSVAVLAGRLRALGYDVSSSSDTMAVAIQWQVSAPIGGDYIAYVHLLDGNTKVAQGDDHTVGGLYYPSSMWQVGEVIQDDQTIVLPQELQSGNYTLLAGFYSENDMANLGEPVIIGTVHAGK